MRTGQFLRLLDSGRLTPGRLTPGRGGADPAVHYLHTCCRSPCRQEATSGGPLRAPGGALGGKAVAGRMPASWQQRTMELLMGGAQRSAAQTGRCGTMRRAWSRPSLPSVALARMAKFWLWAVCASESVGGSAHSVPPRSAWALCAAAGRPGVRPLRSVGALRGDMGSGPRHRLEAYGVHGDEVIAELSAWRTRAGAFSIGWGSAKLTANSAQPWTSAKVGPHSTTHLEVRADRREYRLPL